MNVTGVGLQPARQAQQTVRLYEDTTTTGNLCVIMRICGDLCLSSPAKGGQEGGPRAQKGKSTCSEALI